MSSRFFESVKTGLRPGGRALKTAKQPTKVLPFGCYDTGDGIFDPKKLRITSFDNSEKVLRLPSQKECEWIVNKCRKSWTAPTGYRADFNENWSDDAPELPYNLAMSQDSPETWWKRLSTFPRDSAIDSQENGVFRDQDIYFPGSEICVCGEFVILGGRCRCTPLSPQPEDHSEDTIFDGSDEYYKDTKSTPDSSDLSVDFQSFGKSCVANEMGADDHKKMIDAGTEMCSDSQDFYTNIDGRSEKSCTSEKKKKSGLVEKIIDKDSSDLSGDFASNFDKNDRSQKGSFKKLELKSRTEGKSEKLGGGTLKSHNLGKYSETRVDNSDHEFGDFAQRETSHKYNEKNRKDRRSQDFIKQTNKIKNKNLEKYAENDDMNLDDVFGDSVQKQTPRKYNERNGRDRKSRDSLEQKTKLKDAVLGKYSDNDEKNYLNEFGDFAQNQSSRKFSEDNEKNGIPKDLIGRKKKIVDEIFEKYSENGDFVQKPNSHESSEDNGKDWKSSDFIELNGIKKSRKQSNDDRDTSGKKIQNEPSTKNAEPVKSIGQIVENEIGDKVTREANSKKSAPKSSGIMEKEKIGKETQGKSIEKENAQIADSIVDPEVTKIGRTMEARDFSTTVIEASGTSEIQASLENLDTKPMDYFVEYGDKTPKDGKAIEAREKMKEKIIGEDGTTKLRKDFSHDKGLKNFIEYETEMKDVRSDMKKTELVEISGQKIDDAEKPIVEAGNALKFSKMTLKEASNFRSGSNIASISNPDEKGSTIGNLIATEKLKSNVSEKVEGIAIEASSSMKDGMLSINKLHPSLASLTTGKPQLPGGQEIIETYKKFSGNGKVKMEPMNPNVWRLSGSTQDYGPKTKIETVLAHPVFAAPRSKVVEYARKPCDYRLCNPTIREVRPTGSRCRNNCSAKPRQ